MTEMHGATIEQSSTPELGGASAAATRPDPLDADLKTIAEVGDYDDYKRERADQDDYKKGNPELFREDRKAQYDERWSRVSAKMRAETAKALGSESFDFEDRLKWERIHTSSNVRAELYEREAPGFAQRTRDTAAQYGTLSHNAASVIGESPLVSEISDFLCHNPEQIAQLNQLPQHEIALAVARFEGMHAGAGRSAAQQPPPPLKPKTVSSAPPPVQTVSGRAHNAGKSPEDMSYDEYRAWRMRRTA